MLGKYVLIGWNDLGMHCISPRFAEMAILPPYNNIQAIVIKRGGEPSIVSRDLSVKYSLDGSLSVQNKTDFWTYVEALFGNRLTPGVDLTGNKLFGTMTSNGRLFTATGVPALPYTDTLIFTPLQIANLGLYEGKNRKPTMSVKIVVPVSDEMNCARCHANGKAAAKKMKTRRSSRTSDASRSARAEHIDVTSAGAVPSCSFR